MPTTAAHVPPAGTTPAQGSWPSAAGGGEGGLAGAPKLSGGGVIAMSPGGGVCGPAPMGPDREAASCSLGGRRLPVRSSPAPTDPSTSTATTPTTVAMTPAL